MLVQTVLYGRSGSRALEPWLATRVPGRATGSPYIDKVHTVAVQLGLKKRSAITLSLAVCEYIGMVTQQHV
jgi:hypothetical protein